MACAGDVECSEWLGVVEGAWVCLRGCLFGFDGLVISSIQLGDCACLISYCSKDKSY